MSTRWHIGCSGYYYPYWKNLFYPEGLQPRHWLAYYNTVFNTVELNGTFYRVPKEGDLNNYAAATSDDFSFSVKVNKYITHNVKLKDTKKLIAEFQDLIYKGIGSKLAFFLFQLSPSFHFNEENLSRVIENIPHKPDNAVEFRHVSWWNDETQKTLEEAQITFCNVDYPGIDSYYIHTSDRFYLRLHGTPLLFQSPYSSYRLRNFYKKVPPGLRSCHAYFNNTDRNAAYKDALQLMKIAYKNA
jgi:uncharacterized protein YecE (DUF72 family)